jgi:hypothetical protein
MRIPLPPPPADGLTISGQPMRRASAVSVPSSCASPSYPTMVATPRPATSRRAAALSPMAAMAAAGGPTQAMPASTTARANAGFSARNP